MKAAIFLYLAPALVALATLSFSTCGPAFSPLAAASSTLAAPLLLHLRLRFFYTCGPEWPQNADPISMQSEFLRRQRGRGSKASGKQSIREPKREGSKASGKQSGREAKLGGGKARGGSKMMQKLAIKMRWGRQSRSGDIGSMFCGHLGPQVEKKGRKSGKSGAKAKRRAEKAGEDKERRRKGEAKRTRREGEGERKGMQQKCNKNWQMNKQNIKIIKNWQKNI